MLSVLGQLGAPESVMSPIREGELAAADHAWEFIKNSRLAGRKWLLVFDDADDPAALAVGRGSPADGSGWLRPDVGGMVIVTTRNRDQRVWGHWARIRELEPLDDNASASVLRDLAPSIRESAVELGRRLGGLPLALHLAGTYMASPFARWNSFADYLGALDSEGLSGALAELDDPGAQARATVTRTWEMSLEALSAEGRPHARGLLFYLSCFAAATPVPSALLDPALLGPILRKPGRRPAANATAVAGSDAAAIRTRERLRDSGMYALAAVGLVNVTADPSAPGHRFVIVHPVIADVNRIGLLASARDEFQIVSLTAVTTMRAACGSLNVRDPADWPTWRRLIPHATALLSWASPALDEANLATLVTTVAISARALWRSGNPAAAEDLARSALTAALRLGADHPATLVARTQLAQAIALSRYYEAEQMLRSLLPDQRRVLGKDHHDTLATERVLARLTGLQGRYQEAERMYRRLLAHRLRLLGLQHPETLATRHGLAGMVERLGHYQEAEVMFRTLLDDQRQFLGDDHQECLEIRSGLGRSIEDQSRHQEAEQLYQQLLADEGRVLGEDHPGTLNTRQNLARVIAAQGRMSQAEQLYRQLFADRERILGKDHPITIATREFLAEAAKNSNATLAGQPGIAPVEALMHTSSPNKQGLH
jgi:tetratricopeptide (TPR) repeat protein